MPGLKECLLPAFMFGFKNSISFCVHFFDAMFTFPPSALVYALSFPFNPPLFQFHTHYCCPSIIRLRFVFTLIIDFFLFFFLFASWKSGKFVVDPNMTTSHCLIACAFPFLLRSSVAGASCSPSSVSDCG